MRKIIFHLETGTCGTESNENGLFPDDVTDEQLDLEAWDRAVNNAEAYGIYPESWLDEYLDEELDELDETEYSSNIEGYWEDYDPEKHDGLVAGGGDCWIWR